LRSCGRVAEGGGLLNRYRLVKAYRGFESLRLRQSRTELRTPFAADFTPAMAASVLSKSLFDPMMRNSLGSNVIDKEYPQPVVPKAYDHSAALL
jgi:hypothetical protein